MSQTWIREQHAKATCPLCSSKIPKRVTYLWKPELDAWICKQCWSIETEKEKKD